MPASNDYTDFNFTRDRHDTIELDLTLTLAGVPLPISSLTEIWFTAKLNVSQADPGVFQETKSGGEIVATNDPAGEARVTIPPADTAGLSNQTTLLCDVQTKETAGNRITTVLRGKLVIRPDITQAIV